MESCLLPEGNSRKSINRVVRVPYEGPSSQTIFTAILATRRRVFPSGELRLWCQGVVLRVRILSRVPRLKVVTMEKGILTQFSLQRKCILSRAISFVFWTFRDTLLSWHHLADCPPPLCKRPPHCRWWVPPQLYHQQIWRCDFYKIWPHSCVWAGRRALDWAHSPGGAPRVQCDGTWGLCVNTNWLWSVWQKIQNPVTKVGVLATSREPLRQLLLDDDVKGVNSWRNLL